jgi:hypothetical protein
MGLFNIFKKGSNPNNSTTDNGVLGPTFLDNLTIHIDNPNDLQSHEWRRQLRSINGRTKFSIKYYGRIHENHSNLIVGTDFAPPLIYAIDNSSGQEILLFDGCKHGYNALLCDKYTTEQISNREALAIYQDKDGCSTFEITISTYNGIDFDDEFSEEVDENGFIKIIDGAKIEFETFKRNAYDTLQIWATNENGKTIEIVSEELA